ncbi:MAG: COG2958 family protein [Candidatus Rifleibacteriota bacterium]
MINSYEDLAFEVLKIAKQPMTYQEIWELAKETGLAEKLKTTGKTPWQSLGSRLYVDVRDNTSSKFIKVGKRPARFFLKSRETELSNGIVAKIEKESLKETKKDPGFKERDLHALLAYFAYSNPSFNRGKAIYTKTIFHEASKKNGYNEWVHPDMVGFYIPLDDWQPEVIEFNRISDNNSIKIYSFELKRSLTKGNYRESFFQAVSNSSWAHEGYLVAAEIIQDDEFLAELERLSTSFGIGIIQLDLQDLDSSSVLFPSKGRPSLDWETVNKLCDQNPDFRKFVEDVKIDFDSKRIHRSEFDSILKDPSEYIKNTLKVKI